MPAVTSAADEESKAEIARQQMWAALKKHIIRERQRKKEEHEAEVEEERLRKEREARERQDVMTLGETREQIQQLDQKLTQLKDEKHQLFLQLKKVLNEDDNRKRQQNKDSNEMLAMNGMVSGGNNMVQSHLFLPPTVSQGNPNMGRPPLSAHVLNKSGGAGHKRGRSPSPSYLTMVAGPHSAPYLHHSHHKQQHTTPYQHKIEDGRCREMSRAVLWNKPSQYSTGGGGGSLYALPPQPEQRVQPVMYGTPLYHPHHVQHHTSPKQVVMSVGDSHQERGGGGGYNPASPASSSSLPSGSSLSLSLSSVNSVRHPQQLMSQQMHQAVAMQHNNVQNAKQGGITSGYPVRQQNPSVQNPNLYPNRHRY